MKKTLYFILFAASISACTPPTTTTTDNKPDSNKVAVGEPKDTMDITPPVDSGSTGVVTDPDNTQPGNETNPTPGRKPNPNLPTGKYYTVTGHILVKGSYCGGAAPSQEILDRANAPQPFANQSFLIRNGKMNALGTAMVTRVMTDANGDFKVDLTPGTYCMVLAEKENVREPGFYKLQNQAVDKGCDTKWLNGCDLSFTVADKNVSGLRKTFDKKCFITSLSPCITWDGPLPPSAAPRGK
jgi:hypothetical protein